MKMEEKKVIYNVLMDAWAFGKNFKPGELTDEEWNELISSTKNYLQKYKQLEDRDYSLMSAILNALMEYKGREGLIKKDNEWVKPNIIKNAS